MIRKLTVCAAAIVSLTGCVGPLVEIDDPKIMSTEAKVIPISDAPIAGATSLGAIEGYSCKNKIWDPSPTKTAVDDQLRIKARALGATAIASVKYENKGTTLQPNCWSSIKGTAIAVRASAASSSLPQ